MYQRLMDIMSERLLPIATKIGSQKHLVALRDSFIATMPVVMTGSICIIVKCFFCRFSC